ncbi:hexosaminidase [Entomortierella parvispora]|uniref:beta-N-acetylhexosaminidase n=1 Tax=Entomortierella parvispora TaxID=205924 RepID=A0A9P3HCG4_9FUNG|nr:hexosaminidase [Entomortierella parvispora]
MEDSDMPISGGCDIRIDLAHLPNELFSGLTFIADNTPQQNISLGEYDDFQDVEFHWLLRFEKDPLLAPGECSVRVEPQSETTTDRNQNEIVVRYHRKIEAFRSLGRILGASRQIQGPDPEKTQSLLNYSERCTFDNLAVMIDCSRGGVLKQSSVYALLRNCALMGINMMQLYTEDTYEMDGETFFGYLRGGYTHQELKNIDDYADALGIELVACIQTLGHLGQMLQWPKYHIYRDTNEVLLANWDETYKLIEKMITSICAPLRSKRIHIGLDEAGGVGEGRYRQIFGYEDPSRVFLHHLRRVQDICKRLGLQPMIWSDMLFTLASKNNSLAGYYDGGTPQLAENLPPDIDLVYWDYYHTASESYANKIEQHRELGCANPWVATAAWTWNRFWTALPFTFATIQASCQASKRKIGGVKNMMITIWGDEGHECDMFSSLPAMYYFADHGYTLEDEIDMDRLKKCFEGVCGATFDDWVYASKIDQVTDSDVALTLKTHFAPNTSKYLLWEDPFLAHISPQYAHLDLETHYSEVANNLAQVIEFKDEFPQNARLRMAYYLARALSLKCHLHSRMALAYQQGRRQELFDLTEGRLKDLQEAVNQLWKYHRSMWHKSNKPFGWEVVELRYGGLQTRLSTMRDRILEYIESFERWQQLQQQQQQLQLQEGTLGLLATSNGAASSYGSNGNNGFGGRYRRGSLMSDDDERPLIPEFEVNREAMYEYAGCNLLMDYARVSTPSRPG